MMRFDAAQRQMLMPCRYAAAMFFSDAMLMHYVLLLMRATLLRFCAVAC